MTTTLDLAIDGIRTDGGTIAVDVRPGSQRDAILYSLGANAAHGRRRTNADKRRAVQRMLSDEEWSRWSHTTAPRDLPVARAGYG